MKKIPKRARKQIINITVLLVLIGITVFVLLKSNEELNFGNLLSFIKNSNPWYLVGAVACMIAGIVFEGLSIYLISRKFGHKGKVISAIAYSSADIYFSAITPSATGGQPASAYYMVKDGMGAGTASFTLLLNAIAYTTALVILTVFAFALRPAFFAGFEPLVKFFIIFGVCVQVILLGLFVACMFCHRAVLKLGNGIITLLKKMHIVKNDEKWRTKLADEIDKYRNCVREIRKHILMFLCALLLNICQRVARIIISCLICMTADPTTSFWDIFALQSFVIVGYTSLPVPGGVGAFEYLYLHIYRTVYESDAFILLAMMVMRTISYYVSIIVSGTVTLAYHIYLLKRKRPEKTEKVEPLKLDQPEGEAAQAESEESETSGENTDDMQA